MKRAIVAALAAAIVACLPGIAAAGSVDIRKIDNADFPTTTLTVSIDGKTVTDKDVKITEDDVAVDTASVQPLSESGRGVDIVLVLDTSGSMKGAPIASATAAALRFVTKVPNDIRVGIVTFSDKPHVLTRLTENHSSSLRALGALRAAGETALYDAIKTATALFSGDSQRNIVVLSDGADTSSAAKLESATGAARSAHATVFTVGLTSGDFDATALKKVAEGTGGSYAPVATADLGSLYEDLATKLSSQYLVTYSSKHEAGGEVSVTVSAAGGSDSVLTLTPKVEAPSNSPRASEPEPSPLMLTGGAGLALTLVVCFLALFLFLTMMMGANHRNKRDRELQRRTAVAGQGQSPAESSDEPGMASWIPEPLIQVAEAMAPAGFTARLDHRLERSGLPLRTGEFLVGSVLAAFAGVFITSLLFGNLLLALLVATICSVAPRTWLGFIVRRRSSKMHGQLADILMIIANALRAGHSFFQALDLVAKEVDAPAREEFGRVVAEIRLGRPVDQAMDALAERVGSDDFKWALLAVNIQREVGGNLAEVLDTVSDTIRERDAIRRQVQVLTAEGRLSVGILTALPIGVAAYMSWVNPEYIGLLFNNPLGLLMTAVATSLLVVGVVWMKKVVKIDV